MCGDPDSACRRPRRPQHATGGHPPPEKVSGGHVQVSVREDQAGACRTCLRQPQTSIESQGRRPIEGIARQHSNQSASVSPRNVPGLSVEAEKGWSPTKG